MAKPAPLFKLAERRPPQVDPDPPKARAIRLLRELANDIESGKIPDVKALFVYHQIPTSEGGFKPCYDYLNLGWDEILAMTVWLQANALEQWQNG